MTLSASTNPTRSRADAAPAPKRLDVQGLRALAVLAVISNHLFEWPTGAFVGVDVFFVISGFIITSGLLREYETTEAISFTGFYRRRIKRIIPAATLVLLVTCCASFVLLSRDRFVSTVGDAIAAFFFASNWRFQRMGTDYFAEGLPPSPLQHYWSLSIEEQFYFVWPWLLLGLMLVGVTRLGWSHRHLRAVAGSTIGVLAVASFAWAMLLTESDQTSAYFSTLTRVWELGIGALVAVVAPWVAIRNVAARTLLAWVGLIAIGVSLFIVPDGAGFPAPWAALPVLATALVIIAGVGGDQRYLWPLVSRQGTYVGDLSYSLYLWHWPIIVLLAAVVETGTAAYYATAVILIAVLSTASFHYFEDPVRHATWARRGRRGKVHFNHGWRVVAMGACAIPVLALVAYVLIPSNLERGALAASSGVFTDDQTIAEQETDQIRCVGAAAMVPANDCKLNTDSGTYPTPDELDTSLGAYDCFLNKETPFKVCHFGSDVPGATKIAIVGDSHAALLVPAIREWLGDLNWSIDSFSGENCQWEANGGSDQGCVARGDIQERLETGMYDAVITTTARGRYPNDWDVAASIAQYKELWEPVIAKGTQVIVFADNPLPSPESLLCVQRVGFSAAEDRCGTPEAEAYGKPDLPVLVADELPGVKVLDLRDYFCADGFCPSVIGNVIVYRDEAGHMTEPYAATLGQFLVPEIRAALRSQK